MGQSDKLVIGALVLLVVAIVAYFAYKKWWLPKHPKTGGFRGSGYCPCGCGAHCSCAPSCRCRRSGQCPFL